MTEVVDEAEAEAGIEEEEEAVVVVAEEDLERAEAEIGRAHV